MISRVLIKGDKLSFHELPPTGKSFYGHATKYFNWPAYLETQTESTTSPCYCLFYSSRIGAKFMSTYLTPEEIKNLPDPQHEEVMDSCRLQAGT